MPLPGAKFVTTARLNFPPKQFVAQSAKASILSDSEYDAPDDNVEVSSEYSDTMAPGFKYEVECSSKSSSGPAATRAMEAPMHPSALQLKSG